MPSSRFLVAGRRSKAAGQSESGPDRIVLVGVLAKWQRQGKCRAGTDPGASCLDTSSVELDQFSVMAKSESEAAVQPRRRGIPLSEALENVRQDLRCNADSRIGDRDLDRLSAFAAP